MVLQFMTKWARVYQQHFVLCALLPVLSAILKLTLLMNVNPVTNCKQLDKEKSTLMFSGRGPHPAVHTSRLLMMTVIMMFSVVHNSTGRAAYYPCLCRERRRKKRHWKGEKMPCNKQRELTTTGKICRCLLQHISLKKRERERERAMSRVALDRTQN